MQFPTRFLQYEENNIIHLCTGFCIYRISVLHYSITKEFHYNLAYCYVNSDITKASKCDPKNITSTHRKNLVEYQQWGLCLALNNKFYIKELHSHVWHWITHTNKLIYKFYFIYISLLDCISVLNTTNGLLDYLWSHR